MEKFSLQHTVLYSKGWYKRYDSKGKRKTIWDDLAITLEMDGYMGTFIGDSPEQVKHRITYLLVSQLERLPVTGHSRTLSNFYTEIKEQNCWKYGYYTKNNGFLRQDLNNNPEYDYNEAVARYCLSSFQNLDRNEWEVCEPHYSKLPRKNGVTDKSINKILNKTPENVG